MRAPYSSVLMHLNRWAITWVVRTTYCLLAVQRDSRLRLGVYDFVKRTSFTQFTKERLEEVAKHITTLARTEGLEAHARAIEVRFEK